MKMTFNTKSILEEKFKQKKRVSGIKVCTADSFCGSTLCEESLSTVPKENNIGLGEVGGTWLECAD